MTAPLKPKDQHSFPGSVSELLRLYRSSMLRRFGPFYHLLGLGFFFRKLRLRDQSVERIRRAADAGHVVYVLHTRSRMDWLALNQALNARRLPIAGFTSGVRATFFMPIPQAVQTMWRWAKHRLRHGPLPDPVESGMLTAVLDGGHRACLFIHRERTLRDRFFPRPMPDVVGALFRAQEQLSRPIQLVPTVVIWNRAPAAARTEVGRFLLGNEDWPGAIGKFLAIATRHSDAIVQVGEAVSLPMFIERYANEPAARRERMLRIALRRFLFREQSVIRGPRIRSYKWMRRLVLRSREINELVRTEAKRTGQSEADVRRFVERTYGKIAARFVFAYVRWADRFLRWLWKRMYSGIDIRDEDLDRVREAVRKGTPILVPCHRSHMDYLLLSQLLVKHDIIVPHIVAGMNLSFFPAGNIARRMGAFFIKRRFGDDPIFPVVFERYLRQLVREGFPVEFFIEGGRSRTGKMLPPKLGVLQMVMNAADSVARDQFAVTFLPVYIGYERIAEAGAYAKELSGGAKQKESISAVMSARRIFRQRYGKVYVRVGEPIDAREELNRHGQPWASLDPAARLLATRATGDRLVAAIGHQAVVLPSSLAAVALLIPRRKGLKRTQLQKQAMAFLVVAQSEGAHCSDTLVNTEWALDRAVRRFIHEGYVEAFEGDSGPIYRAVPEHRVALEFHKNTVVAFLATGSMLALALRSANADAVPRGQAIERFTALSEWWQDEFIFDPDQDIEARVARGASQLELFGAIEVQAERLRIVDRQRLDDYADLTVALLESYHLTARALRRLTGQRFDDNSALAQAIRQVGEGLLAVDEVRRPEALSSVTIRNALQRLGKADLFHLDRSGRLHLERERLRSWEDAMKIWRE